MQVETVIKKEPAPGRTRRNDPAALRSRLLDVAGKIAIDKGVASVTLDAVAQGAGVSKGGLLHHFRGKRALLDAMFERILAWLEKRIAVFAKEDADAFGRFTRAYLMTVTHADVGASEENRLFGVLSLAMTTDMGLRSRWQEWIKDQMALYGEMADSPELWIVQYAADGLWLADLTEGMVFAPAFRERMVSRLVEMTRASAYRQENGDGTAVFAGEVKRQNKKGKPKSKT
ncbi:MAG: TetR/AcrR family transcriptional regulator [Oxalobacter sp.]|nr:TetR/AcrR family transcriptional regulator [Oxalobacter sp.]